jgi:CBS domain-containing protein
MAAIDPVAYVRATPPFDALPEAVFGEAARTLEIAWYPAGLRLARAGGRPLEHLYVIRAGSVRLERDGHVLQVLEEGETFGYTSLLTGKATLDVQVEESLLAYRLPDAEFRRLLAEAKFAGHFAVGLAQRLRSSLRQGQVATFQADLGRPVGDLVRRGPVWVGAGATVADAARLMREHRISSVLVRTDPPGIVTDRDLRGRVLARRLGPETPVAEVLSRPLQGVEAETPVYLAWATLLDANVHHLPVTRRGEIVGVLGSGDLLTFTAQGPIALLRTLERYESRESLPGYARSVSEMVAAMLQGGLDALVIAGFVARVSDALVRRILQWAEQDLGPPPAPYAWMAMGSEGRMEQTLLTDQDNALVYADEGGPRRDWYQALAERANADLETAGYPPCLGNHMARRWNDSLSTWTRRFDGIVDGPRPHDAELFFDYRRVAGTLDLAPLEAALGRAARTPVLLRFLAREAMEFSPPASLLLRLRGESSVVDLKRHGIIPVVFLARCYGLEVGGAPRTTLARLEAARERGLVSEGVLRAIAEAYRFLLGLRLRLQLRSLSEGKEPGNEVALADLTGLERSRLKESFRAIKRWQEKASYHYQTDFL